MLFVTALIANVKWQQSQKSKWKKPVQTPTSHASHLPSHCNFGTVNMHRHTDMILRAEREKPILHTHRVKFQILMLISKRKCLYYTAFGVCFLCYFAAGSIKRDSKNQQTVLDKL